MRWTCWGLSTCGLAHGQALLTPPYASIIDRANVLQPQEVTSLAEALRDVRSRTGASVAILMVNSTLPESIEEFSNRVANDWKLGGAANGIGVLVVVAVRDRSARIEVSRALEGALPDLYGKRILKESVSPHFARGEYHLGLLQAIRRIDLMIQTEVSNSQPTAKEQWRQSTPLETAAVGTLIVSMFLIFWLTFAFIFRWRHTYLLMAVGSVIGSFQVLAASSVGPSFGWSSGVLVAAVGILLPWWFARRSETRSYTESTSSRRSRRTNSVAQVDNSVAEGTACSISSSDDTRNEGVASSWKGDNGPGGGGDFAGGGSSDKW